MSSLINLSRQPPSSTGCGYGIGCYPKQRKHIENTIGICPDRFQYIFLSFAVEKHLYTRKDENTHQYRTQKQQRMCQNKPKHQQQQRICHYHFQPLV